MDRIFATPKIALYSRQLLKCFFWRYYHLVYLYRILPFILSFACRWHTVLFDNYIISPIPCSDGLVYLNDGWGQRLPIHMTTSVLRRFNIMYNAQDYTLNKCCPRVYCVLRKPVCEEVRTYNTRLLPSLLIEMFVTSQESKRSYSVWGELIFCLFPPIIY